MHLEIRRKLDIIVEAHAVAMVEEMLGSAGVKGWSVFVGAEGAGAGGVWRQTGIGAAGEMRLLIAIVNQDACDQALTWLNTFFQDYPGIVAVSDVGVLRGERF
jgi:hypothetical protein